MCEPRPLAQARQIGSAAPVGAWRRLPATCAPAPPACQVLAVDYLTILPPQGRDPGEPSPADIAAPGTRHRLPPGSHDAGRPGAWPDGDAHRGQRRRVIPGGQRHLAADRAQILCMTLSEGWGKLFMSRNLRPVAGVISGGA